MKDADKKEIQAAFDQATSALKNLEKVIGNHYLTPFENINILEFNKIQIPKNYIRKVAYFIKEYNLIEIVNEHVKRKNICYSLLQSDFHNYLINRIQVYGAVESLFLKIGIINLVSIIEALIVCSLSKLHLFCVTWGESSGDYICKKQVKCGAYINKTNTISFENAIKLFCSKIAPDNPTLEENLKKLKTIRNNVHISLVLESEHSNDDYTIANYNLAVKTLEFFKINQLRLIREFESKQLQDCLMFPF
ncbi:hypothetical protein [Pedobacter sp. FW305-3-2-15-E-R2A2]|uniref:hypothetical protein n=1 Tax=Pedobacter sp. FW305-3-2-15-E-R2A2 TaxID=3140251 RepID=UPI0031402527